MDKALQNNTSYTEDQVEKWIIEQFGYEGFIILQISGRHYQNRVLPDGISILDVQIGYMVPTPNRKIKTRVANILNLTLIIRDKEQV